MKTIKNTLLTIGLCLFISTYSNAKNETSFAGLAADTDDPIECNGAEVVEVEVVLKNDVWVPASDFDEALELLQKTIEKHSKDYGIQRECTGCQSGQAGCHLEFVEDSFTDNFFNLSDEDELLFLVRDEPNHAHLIKAGTYSAKIHCTACELEIIDADSDSGNDDTDSDGTIDDSDSDLNNDNDDSDGTIDDADLDIGTDDSDSGIDDIDADSGVEDTDVLDVEGNSGDLTDNLYTQILSYQTGKVIAYPNPTSKEVTVKVVIEKETEYSLIVRDYSGKLVKQTNTGILSSGGHHLQMSVADLKAGMYIISCESKNTRIGQTKLIVE